MAAPSFQISNFKFEMPEGRQTARPHEWVEGPNNLELRPSRAHLHNFKSQNASHNVLMRKSGEPWM